MKKDHLWMAFQLFLFFRFLKIRAGRAIDDFLRLTPSFFCPVVNAAKASLIIVCDEPIPKLEAPRPFASVALLAIFMVRRTCSKFFIAPYSFLCVVHRSSLIHSALIPFSTAFLASDFRPPRTSRADHLSVLLPHGNNISCSLLQKHLVLPTDVLRQAFTP